MGTRVKWDATGRLLESTFGLVTAIASVVLAYVAVQALQEARARVAGRACTGEPQRGVDRRASAIDLGAASERWRHGPRDCCSTVVEQGQRAVGMMQPIKELPPDARFYNAELCEGLTNGAPCVYQVRVIAVNKQKGQLSRPGHLHGSEVRLCTGRGVAGRLAAVRIGADRNKERMQRLWEY